VPESPTAARAALAAASGTSHGMPVIDSQASSLNPAPAQERLIEEPGGDSARLKPAAGGGGPLWRTQAGSPSTWR
jgi:hypothetical protein